MFLLTILIGVPIGYMKRFDCTFILLVDGIVEPIIKLKVTPYFLFYFFNYGRHH